MSTTTVRQYCGLCCDAAEKAGREVRQTDAYEYPLCRLCEGRIREGLVHYHPSNGTEFRMFESRCERCRHYDDAGTMDAKVKACKWGILDKLLNGMFSDADSGNFWFMPDELEDTCPATCLRFTDQRDGDGPTRDPPPPDCTGQMFFSDVLTVPERSPATEVSHA